MGLLKFLLGILLLRRLPGGRVMSWLVRLGIWSWLVSLAVKKLKPFLAENPVNPGMRTPSGWTAGAGESAAPVEAFESAHVSTTITASPSGASPGASGAVETVTESVSETTAIWGMPADETSGVETVPAAAAPDVALEQDPEPHPESEPLFAPRWIQGDGTIECPDEFPIKGKATSMIYHEPGTHHYSVTIPDVCYYSSEDAAQAGYRPPKR